MIRWLVVLGLLMLGVPAQADEMRPVAIQFEQVGEGEWRLSWRQPIASAADDRMAVPQIPENCRMAGDVERQRGSCHGRRRTAGEPALPQVAFPGSRLARPGFR